VGQSQGNVDRSGQQGNAFIGTEQEIGRGPTVEETHDDASRTEDEAPRGVEDLPTQGLRTSLSPAAFGHSNWNHRTRSPARATTINQFAVRFETGEREPAEPGLLQSLDVTLDVSMGLVVTSSCTGSPSASV
jgi:hypothetical protein